MSATAFTIYVFNNGGSPGWYSAAALCDCGRFVAGHICSHPGFIPHDMGLTSDWKHETYHAHAKEAHAGAEWRLELVPDEQVSRGEIKHAGMASAYAEHQRLGAEARAARGES